MEVILMEPNEYYARWTTMMAVVHIFLIALVFLLFQYRQEVLDLQLDFIALVMATSIPYYLGLYLLLKGASKAERYRCPYCNEMENSYIVEREEVRITGDSLGGAFGTEEGNQIVGCLRCMKRYRIKPKKV